MHRWVLLVGCCMAVASCGDGSSSGGGTIATVPGGTPTPTVSPTPTPTPALNTGEIKPTPDAAFLAATMEMTTTGGATNSLTGRTTGGTTSNRSTALDTPGFAASYGATTGYALADAMSTAKFGPADLTSDSTATDPINPTVFFTKVASPVEDYLALYKVIATIGSSTLTPKYGGIGGWQHTVADAAGRRTRLDYFAFGSPTPSSGIPRSGVVKFFVAGFGNYADDTNLYFTTEIAATLTVDFGAGTISGLITATGKNFFVDSSGGLYGVTMAGTIIGNAVTGATAIPAAPAPGRFRLLFVGPNADEVILTLVGNDGRGMYVGSSVGFRTP